MGVVTVLPVSPRDSAHRLTYLLTYLLHRAMAEL